MRSGRVVAGCVVLAVLSSIGVSLLLRRRPVSSPGVGIASSGSIGMASASARPLGSGTVRLGAPSMLHLDPHHTNRSPFRAPMGPHVAWTYDTGGPIAAQPAVADGRVVVASLSGRVASLDVSGEARWQVDLGERVYASPLVMGDVIYVGVDKGHMVALSAKTGAVRFRLDVDGDADTGAVPLPGGGMAFTAGHSAYAMRDNGTVRWRYKLARKVFSSPAVGDDGSIFFGGQDDSLTALRPDGTLSFRVALGADSDAAPAVGDDGTIYAGSDAGEVVAIDPQSGAIRWRTAVGGFVRGALSVRRDGSLLASTYGPVPAIVALDGRGGILWKFSIRGTGAKMFGIHGAPIEDSEGTLVFGAQDDFVYALDRDGRERWKLKVGGDVDQATILAEEGVLYAGCEDGKLYALRD